jgi:DNA modification methylase
MINLLHGDCLEQMKTLEDNSVDSIVSDPPYGISFMAKKWDYDVPSVEVWKEAMRVLKPGGHALIACGTRTQHRMVVNIEDAGFEIRDVVSWIYGSGFPKSHNVSKAIDKAAGAERGRTKCATFGGSFSDDEGTTYGTRINDNPATEAAKQWDGWGTALKPSCEFFTLCRKPLSEKTIAANVLKWGTGGINIDGCRVGTEDDLSGGTYGGAFSATRDADGNLCKAIGSGDKGRFPANLIHDGSQEVLELFPETKPKESAARFFKSCEFDGLDLTFERAKALLELWKIKNANTVDASSLQPEKLDYTALSHAVIAASLGDKQLSEWKALSIPETQTELRSLCESLITAMLSSSEGSWPDQQQDVLIPNGCLVNVAEMKGLTDITTIMISLPKSDGYAEPVTFNITPMNTDRGEKVSSPRAFYCPKASKKDRDEGNNHPTVKPTALMAYLCRLITPTGGVVLDPYMGSGSTGKAAVREGFSFIGCELDNDYYEIAKARVGS